MREQSSAKGWASGTRNESLKKYIKEKWAKDTTLRNAGDYRGFLRGAAVRCYLEGSRSQVVLQEAEEVASQSVKGLMPSSGLVEQY